MRFFRRFTLKQLHSEEEFLRESVSNAERVIRHQRKTLKQVRRAIKEKQK